MDNHRFEDLCNAVTWAVNKLDDNYRIVRETGLRLKNPFEIYIVQCNGQKYLQIYSANIFVFEDIFSQNKFQKVIYHCCPVECGKFILYKNDKTVICEEEFTIEKLIEEVFGFVEQNLQYRRDIASLLQEHIDFNISPDKIGYDGVEQTFYFIDWDKAYGVEYRFISQFFRVLKKEYANNNRYFNCIAKYTTLNTALSMLNSGKIRVMSVTAMNDRKEIGHLYGNLSNEDTKYLDNKTIIHYARNRYITSFTKRIDDLTMWRLYGDNGNGVCLLFFEPDECNFYYPIDYSGKKSVAVQKCKMISKILEDRGFKFTFKSLETIWQYFLKPNGFRDEIELRYLIIDNSKPDGYILASNGIVSGYKDMLLTVSDSQETTRFPSNLNGIILGPNMKNVDVNKYQLEAMAYEKGIFLLHGVNKSSIDYYI